MIYVCEVPGNTEHFHSVYQLQSCQVGLFWWKACRSTVVAALCAGAQFHTPVQQLTAVGRAGGQNREQGQRGSKRGTSAPAPAHHQPPFRGRGVSGHRQSGGHWLLCATVLAAPARCRPDPRLCRCSVHLAEVSAPPRLPRSPHFLPPSGQAAPPPRWGRQGTAGEGEALPAHAHGAAAFPEGADTELLFTYFAAERPGGVTVGQAAALSAPAQSFFFPPDTHVVPWSAWAVPRAGTSARASPRETARTACSSGYGLRRLPALPVQPRVVPQMQPSYGPQLSRGRGGATRRHAGASVT